MTETDTTQTDLSAAETAEETDTAAMAEPADTAEAPDATDAAEAPDATDVDEAADATQTADAATTSAPESEPEELTVDEPETVPEVAAEAAPEPAAVAATTSAAESTGAAEARQAARLSREAPQPEDPDAAERTTKQWYVIHTYSGYENKVKTNLEHRIESMGVEDQIYQELVPMEEEIEIRNGQRQTVNKKVFPGYVLVEMIMTDESWYVVRNTPGVTSFVGSGNRPTPLREGEVKAILKQMGVEAPKFKVQFEKGQSVRVTDGPFAEFIGTVDEVHPERNKVRVLVSIFGRETPVELDFLQIEKL
jgi:transcriptional antiterminator NusG